MIFLLVVTILGEPPERYNLPQPDIKTCWATAQEISDQLTPDMLKRGVAIACIQKDAREIS